MPGKNKMILNKIALFTALALFVIIVVLSAYNTLVKLSEGNTNDNIPLGSNPQRSLEETRIIVENPDKTNNNQMLPEGLGVVKCGDNQQSVNGICIDDEFYWKQEHRSELYESKPVPYAVQSCMKTRISGCTRQWNCRFVSEVRKSCSNGLYRYKEGKCVFISDPCSSESQVPLTSVYTCSYEIVYNKRTDLIWRGKSPIGIECEG